MGRLRINTVSAVALALGCGACTLVSGVNDFEAGSGAGTLSLQLHEMAAHGGQIVDNAFVDGAGRLTARAAIFLPPVPEGGPGDYPSVRIDMAGARVGEGPFSAHFYADLNQNGELDLPPADHTWLEEVPPSGLVDFVHNIMFVPLSDDDFEPVGADVILRFAEGEDDPRDEFSQQDKVFEVRLVLPDGREIGLYQLHPGPDVEPPDEQPLRGIVDAGNFYEVSVFADGEPVDAAPMELQAETDGSDLVIVLDREFFGFAD